MGTSYMDTLVYVKGAAVGAGSLAFAGRAACQRSRLFSLIFRSNWFMIEGVLHAMFLRNASHLVLALSVAAIPVAAQSGSPI